jgi:hypothetical protein
MRMCVVDIVFSVCALIHIGGIYSVKSTFPGLLFLFISYALYSMDEENKLKKT